MSIQHKDITESNLHEAKGVSTATTGQFLKANGGVGQWDFQEYLLGLDITDIDTAASYYVVCPFAGNITSAYSVIDSAITVADNTLTLSINGTNVTNGVITISFTGAAAGDVDSCSPTALNTVTAGQAIKVTVSGASTTATRCHMTIVIKRTA